METEKGKRIGEFCQISGVFKIKINRLFESFYDLTGQCRFATLPRSQNCYSRIIM